MAPRVWAGGLDCHRFVAVGRHDELLKETLERLNLGVASKVHRIRMRDTVLRIMKKDLKEAKEGKEGKERFIHPPRKIREMENAIRGFHWEYS